MSTEKDAQTETSVRLKEALDVRGLKIKEAAQLCGIPYRSFQNYTLGLREPNADAFRLVCTHLGISLDWLLTGQGPMLRDEGGGIALQETPGSYAADQNEQAMLALWRELDEGAQREIQQAAQDKKRLSAIENQLQELQAAVASLIRSP